MGNLRGSRGKAGQMMTDTDAADAKPRLEAEAKQIRSKGFTKSVGKLRRRERDPQPSRLRLGAVFVWELLPLHLRLRNGAARKCRRVEAVESRGADFRSGRA